MRAGALPGWPRHVLLGSGQLLLLSLTELTSNADLLRPAPTRWPCRRCPLRHPGGQRSTLMWAVPLPHLL